MHLLDRKNTTLKITNTIILTIITQYFPVQIRMDSVLQLRQKYNSFKQIKTKQDPLSNTHPLPILGSLKQYLVIMMKMYEVLLKVKLTRQLKNLPF